MACKNCGGRKKTASASTSASASNTRRVTPLGRFGVRPKVEETTVVVEETPSPNADKASETPKASETETVESTKLDTASDSTQSTETPEPVTKTTTRRGKSKVEESGE